MATNRELESRVKQLEALLAQVGLAVDSASSDLPEDRPDYIAHGSPEHAQFIGLVLLENPEDADGRTVYVSRQTEQMYCLEDEIGVMRFYPGVDPEKAIYTVLRQKVSAFEAGEPPIPENAPTLLVPDLIL